LFSEWELNPSLFYIVYAGNFGNAQSVHTIIESAQLLQSETNIQFLLIGGGSQEDTLKELVTSCKLQNVKFFPLQSSEKLSLIYSLGDVGIVCCKKGMGENAFPSKTWSYLAAGTPIIASYDLDSELASMSNSNGFGISINPENAKEMADSILKLRNNKQLLQEMSSTAKTFVESHASKKKAMERYLQVINSVISSN
jgi:glycosyltransferase involved in cell wall biosynthesis